MSVVFYIHNMSTGRYVCDKNDKRRVFPFIWEAREFINKNRLNTDIYTIVSEIVNSVYKQNV